MDVNNPVTVSLSAAAYLLEQCQNQGHKRVKLSVLGGGCAGFSYKYSFIDELSDGDIAIDLGESHQFVVDGMALVYVLGTHLDYVRELGGSYLALSNPNETSSCGCGSSFAV